MAYRFGGKQKTLALGTYPTTGLAQARRKRDEAREQLASNIDPSIVKQAQKLAMANAQENSFEAVEREFCAGQVFSDTAIGCVIADCCSKALGGKLPSLECSRTLL